VGLAVKWDTIVRLIREGLRRRVGIRRRVENSVGCLSEKRLFINIGNKVVEEMESSWRPAFC
jgi:hypothetical protein